MTDEGRNDAGSAEDELGLEGRLQRIEAILGQLEAGEVELEQALKLFEEGVGHVRRAEEVISRTELKVEELLAGGGTRPVDDGEGT